MTRRTGGAGTLVPLSYWDDPDLMSLSPEARDLHMRLLSWSADKMTDGSIPAAIANMFAAAHSSGAAALAELKRMGFLAPTERGFLVSDWTDYNLCAEEIEIRKQLRIEAGRKGGMASAAGRLPRATGRAA